MVFLGRVEERLKSLLSDTKDEIVPTVDRWVLLECDINKDVQISDMGYQCLNIDNICYRPIRLCKTDRRHSSIYTNNRLPHKPISPAFENWGELLVLGYKKIRKAILIQQFILRWSPLVVDSMSHQGLAALAGTCAT
jgi:hypothetical protein